MAEAKVIYCPLCKHRVMKYDGKGTINLMAECRKCKKLVVYDIEHDEISTKRVPQRETSSGMRFY